MNFAALFSDKTKSALISILEYLRANPQRIDVLIVIAQGEFVAEELTQFLTPQETELLEAFFSAVKSDVDSPKFMRVVMKAVMGKGL